MSSEADSPSDRDASDLNGCCWMTPGALAARSGTAVSTLHYYESLGLIDSSRTAGGRRRYRRHTLRRVAIIRVAHRLGIPLDEVATALATLPHDQMPTDADWERLSNQWRQALDDRIHALTALRDDFTGCIGCGCLSLSVCPQLNPGDKLAHHGPGPHRLTRGPNKTH